MRRLFACALLTGTSLAFPAIGFQPRDVNTPRYRNDSHSHAHVHPPSYTKEPHPVKVEVEVEVDIEVEVEKPLVTKLIPTVHWSVDTSSTEHIIPAPASSVYYAEDGINDPTQKHQMGIMNINYAAPAVILDHSDSLDVTYDPAQGLIITFSTQESLGVATSTWSPDTGLLMITYTEGCGDYENNDFCYFKVAAVSCSPGMVCVASGAPVSHMEAFVSADIEWGTYYPSTPPPASYSGGNSSGISSTGASATGNSTSGDSTTDSDESTPPLCGPADPVYGLPSASLGVYFDESLDDCFGYETVNETTYASYISSLSSGDVLEDNPEDVGDTSSDLEGDDYLLNATLIDNNSTTKRSISLAKRISLVPQIKGVNVPITKDLFQKNIAFQLPKNQKTVDTPFGQGVLLKAFGTKTTSASKGSADLSFYCVECGASGGINLSGRATFAVTTGVTAAELVATADLQVVFQVGIVASAQYSQKFDFKIADIGLPGLSFGIVTIGPQISIGTDVSFNAQANGQLLAGGKFGFQNAKSVINFKDQSKSQSSGWTPQFTPVLKASGNISLSAEVGFPLGLSCSVAIKGFGSLGAGIVERPAIEAKAEFSAELNGKNGAITTTDGCNGIATQITFKNFLFVALNAFKTTKQYDLMAPYTKVLDKGCIKIPGTSNAAPAAVPSAPPSGPTTAVTRRQVSNESLSDITDLVDTTNLTNTSIILPDLDTADYNTTNGASYLSLTDSTSSLILTACSDGNLYFQPYADNDTLSDDSCSTLFQSVKEKVVSDGLGRILHYYNNTMSVLGVSRLRLSDEETIPINSTYLSLNPSSSDSDYYSAVDPAGNEFFPVVCTYTNTTIPAKMFLVQNVTTGLDVLQSADLEFIVTGGVVDQCYYLPIVEETDDGDDFDDDYSVNESDEGGDAEYDSED